MMTVKQARNDLVKLEARSDLLYKKMKRCEKMAAECQRELQSLHGGFRGYGLIERARQKLAEAQRQKEDQEKPIVVWKRPRSRFSYFATKEFVVSRVTKKTIFIRMRGHKQESKFRLDGRSYSSYVDDRIDVAATLHDTVSETPKEKDSETTDG